MQARKLTTTLSMQVTTRTQDKTDIRIVAEGAEFTFRQIAPHALLVTIVGSDEGQFGSTCLDEIRLALMRSGPLTLLFDIEHVVNVSVEVSKQWTAFFAEARGQLRRVDVLTGSKYVHLTVGIAQHLSYTGDLIRIHTDRKQFEDAVVAAST
jgi:hypothetical protein